MKKYYFLLLVPVITFLVLRFNSTVSEKENGFKKERQAETEAEQTDDWLFYQKAFPYETIDKKAQQVAVKNALDLRKKNMMMKIEGGTDDWQFLGPVTIGGRIADIESPIGNDNTVYVGTASGGVLKTYDRGAHWINIFDENESLSIGDIAIDPTDTNIIYVGTGEGGNGVGSVTYDGHGIYKSTDGGATWTNIGITEGGNTGRIAINPLNTQNIFAATLGDLFQNSSERGIYRTNNGGETWEKVLYINDSTGGIDVAINPVHPDTVYATTWQRVRRYYRKDYTGYGSRIYRSTDGGDSWEMLTNGIPNQEFAKITLALSPSNPNIIYAAICGNTEALKDIYKTTDGGDTWTPLNVAAEVEANAQDCWYFGVKVHPEDPDKIFWIGFESWRSLDGGETWNEFATTSHVDHQSFFISPQNDNLKILGTDGGLYFTSNDWATYTTAQNIPVTQLYTLDVYPGDTSRLIGGAQDNGSFVKDAAGNWTTVNGADGVSSKFVPVDENSFYANWQYGGYYGLVDGIVQPLWGFDYDDRHNWRSPIELNPLNPKTIYFGGSKLQRTHDYGTTLETISDDLSNGDQGIGLTFGTIFTIHNAPADTNYIYIGTDDANVWRSKDYGENWELITDGLPYRYCMSIETDPDNAEIVYVAFSGFRWADSIAHIYKSIDAGDTWVSISGDMPDIPVNDIQIAKYPGDTTTLFIATDVGCYYSFNDGVNWNFLGSAMPVVSVYEIYFDDSTQTLFAGTYGRGAWKIAVPQQEPPEIQVVDQFEFNFELYPNPASNYILITSPLQFVNAEIRIYDINGAVVYSSRTSGEKQISVEVNTLPSGNYFLSVEQNGKNAMRKFIVI